MEIEPKEISVDQVRWGQLLAFHYEGRVIRGGVFICKEDDGLQIRLMFAGSTFGRFDIDKVTNLTIDS